MPFSDLDYEYFSSKSFQGRLCEKVNRGAQSTLLAPPVANRWVLTSALQKLLRRGLAAEAKAVALALHDLDPQYLRRRLPIIALEDVSLGGVEACCDVISLCSYSRWWETNPADTIAYALEVLSLSVKSRVACDAFCLTETLSSQEKIDRDYLKRSKKCLVDIAADSSCELLPRLLALRVLGGISRRVHGSFRTITPIDFQSLQAVCARVHLPAAVSWLVSQQRKTRGMSAMLPVVWGLTANHLIEQSQPFPHSFELLGGIPLCSLDTYTQSGKAVLQKFVGTSSEIQNDIWPLINGHAQPLINLAMFQIESSLLDRYVWTPSIAELNQSIEVAELMDLGLKVEESRHIVCEVLARHAASLANLRRLELLRLEEIQRGSQSAQMKLKFHDNA